jgi:hypothetical protein
MSNILDNPNNYVNENEVSFMPVLQKYGLIMASVSIIMTLLTSIMGMSNLMLTMIMGLLALAMMIIIPVLGLKEHRDKQLGGFVSFGRAFLVCMLIIAVGITVSSIFNYIYMNFINPSYIESMKESMTEMYEKMNVPEEQMQEAMSKFDDMKSIGGILKGLAWNAVIAAVFALIIAAIMKRNRPVFN